MEKKKKMKKNSLFHQSSERQVSKNGTYKQNHLFSLHTKIIREVLRARKLKPSAPASLCISDFAFL